MKREVLHQINVVLALVNVCVFRQCVAFAIILLHCEGKDALSV